MSTAIANQILIRRLAEEDEPLVQQMYDTFAPLGVALGLPPVDASRRRAWLAHLQTCINLVAFVDDRIVGHLALMPGGQAAEMALFVHQHFRRQGVGRALLASAVEAARAQGLRVIWALINTDNSAARIGLHNFGFRAVWQESGETQMALEI